MLKNRNCKMETKIVGNIISNKNGRWDPFWSVSLNMLYTFHGLVKFRSRFVYNFLRQYVGCPVGALMFVNEKKTHATKYSNNIYFDILKSQCPTVE